MGAALQDLIDEVDASDSTTTSAAYTAATTAAATTGTTTTTTGTASASSSSALASLQQSFQTLVSSMGGNGNASLSGFLTNFANDLSGMSAVGNLVNTQA